MRKANFNLITSETCKDCRNFIWYKSNRDFNVPYNHFEEGRINSGIVEIVCGDVFGMAQMDFQIYSSVVECSEVMLFNDKLSPVFLSRDLLELNSSHFTDITKVYLRNHKLDQLLR